MRPAMTIQELRAEIAALTQLESEYWESGQVCSAWACDERIKDLTARLFRLFCEERDSRRERA